MVQCRKDFSMGNVIVVIGTGAIGQAIARRVAAWIDAVIAQSQK